MKFSKWKYPAFYLSAVGIANIGGWIYLLAINLMVFNKTGSALAVSGLYMIKPFAHLLMGFWSGSVIDRVSTKHLMIVLDDCPGISYLADSLFRFFMEHLYNRFVDSNGRRDVWASLFYLYDVAFT